MRNSILRAGMVWLACAHGASTHAFEIDDYFGARRVTDLALSAKRDQYRRWAAARAADRS